MRAILALAVSGCLATLASMPTSARQAPQSVESPALDAALQTYCIGCHNQKLRTGGVISDAANLGSPGADPELWEGVIAKLRAGSMRRPVDRVPTPRPIRRSRRGWNPRSIARGPAIRARGRSAPFID